MPPIDPVKIIEVAAIEKLPGFPPYQPAETVDYLLTRLFRSDGRLLHGEFRDDVGRWYIQNRMRDTEELVAEITLKAFFRAMLASIRHRYLAGQLYGGFRDGLYTQDNKSRYVAMYMANDALRGFWFQAYARLSV